MDSECKMELIGVGFGRTGTDSTREALNQVLNGKCYHMKEVIMNNHFDFWVELAKFKQQCDSEATSTPLTRNNPAQREKLASIWRQKFDKVFRGYKATTDWPACYFWRELLMAYPNVKFLLTVRDPVKWHESCMTTIGNPTTFSRSIPLFLAPFFWLSGFSAKINGIKRMHETILNPTFNDRWQDKQYAIEVFNGHNQAIKDTIPKNQLLVFDVKEGWGPLCDFLNVKVPSNPYPHTNTREDFQKMIESQKQGAKKMIFAVSVVAVVVVGVLIKTRM